jgi:hypothetical protein
MMAEVVWDTICAFIVSREKYVSEPMEVRDDVTMAGSPAFDIRHE